MQVRLRVGQSSFVVPTKLEVLKTWQCSARKQHRLLQQSAPIRHGSVSSYDHSRRMRVRHVMNKQGSAAEQAAEQAANGASTTPEIYADAPAIDSMGEEEVEEQVVTLMDEDTPESMSTPKEEGPDVPDSGDWTGAETPGTMEQIIQNSLKDLLERPESWYALNKRLNKGRAGRDILFAVEELIKEEGPSEVREKFLQAKTRVNADLIWSLHQPLLSLMLFILKETNDIHKKLIKVPELKNDICRAMNLGRPSKIKHSPAPKPKLERAVKSPKGTEDGEKKPKKKKLLKVMHKGPAEEDGAAEDGDTKPPKKKKIKVAKKHASGDEPPAKKRKVTVPPIGGGKTFHQLIASSQERDKSGKFAPGFSPAAAAKLKKVVVKGLALKRANGEPVPPPKKKLTIGVAPKTPKPKPATTPKKKVHRAPKQSVEPPDEALTYQPRATEGDSLEDAEIAALVIALRARGAREARGREEMAVLELDERISDLEVAQRKAEAELAELRARRAVLLGERLGKAGEQNVPEPVKAARDRCLQAIVDLLDVLPANLDLNAVDIFNELEHTDAFDGTLGALANKQRVYLQRDWDRKNSLAADAKRAELDAMRKKNNVRQHLGILAASNADEATECDAIFSAFQLKLIELRREMERKVDLLAEKENVARQAWLVYRAAA